MTKSIEIIIRQDRIDIDETAMKTRGQAGTMSRVESLAITETDIDTMRVIPRVDTTKQVSIDDLVRPQPTHVLPRRPIHPQPLEKAVQTSLAEIMTVAVIGHVVLILETNETVVNRRVDLTPNHDLIKPLLIRQMIL